jgi:hypothetical protein
VLALLQSRENADDAEQRRDEIGEGDAYARVSASPGAPEVSITPLKA